MTVLEEFATLLVKVMRYRGITNAWYEQELARVRALLDDPDQVSNVEDPPWKDLGVDEFTYAVWTLVFNMTEVGDDENPAVQELCIQLKQMLESEDLNCDPNKADMSGLPSPEDPLVNDRIVDLLKQRSQLN